MKPSNNEKVWQELWDDIQSGVFVYVSFVQEGKKHPGYMLIPKEEMGIFEDLLGNNPSELQKNFGSVLSFAITHNLCSDEDEPSVSYFWNADNESLRKI